jgi:hypothetical protein
VNGEPAVAGKYALKVCSITAPAMERQDFEFTIAETVSHKVGGAKGC